MNLNTKKSFTLVELMIVIAILAILSAIVIFTLNPSRLFDNFRDTRRVTDISSIHKAINFMESWNESAINYGNSNTLYISLPDTSSTCSSYILPTLPSGYIYSCKPTSTYKNTDSTGWIPIDFTVTNGNSYLSSLPTDPVNDTTYFYSYYPGGSYEVTALLKNPNDNSINDGDSLTGAFTLGSPNRTWSAPLSRDTNLVGHWKFDEASGDALDYSGNGYIATITGGVSRSVTMGSNKSMYFDGTGYIQTLAFAMPSTGVLSIGVWTKTKNYNLTHQGIVTDGWGTSTGFIYLTRPGNSYNLWYYYATGTGSSGVSFSDFFDGLDDQWIYIATVCDYSNKTIKAYRNGVQFSTSQPLTGSPVFPAVSYTRRIGSYPSSGYNLFDGYLDDVRIYNRALSVYEISQIYNKTKSKYQ